MKLQECFEETFLTPVSKLVPEILRSIPYRFTDICLASVPGSSLRLCLSSIDWLQKLPKLWFLIFILSSSDCLKRVDSIVLLYGELVDFRIISHLTSFIRPWLCSCSSSESINFPLSRFNGLQYYMYSGVYLRVPNFIKKKDYRFWTYWP